MILKTESNEFYRALLDSAVSAADFNFATRDRRPPFDSFWQLIWHRLLRQRPPPGTDIVLREAYFQGGIYYPKKYSHFLGDIVIALQALPGLYFRAEKYDRGWNCSYTQLDKVMSALSGLQQEVSSQPHGPDPVSLTLAVADFAKWLTKEVARYFENNRTPDLWSALWSSPEHADVSDAPFSTQEKEVIREGLGRFRLMLMEAYHPTSQQQERIERKLDHLTDLLAHNLPRTDWGGIAIGAIFNIATTLALTPQRVQDLAALFQSAVSSVIRFLN
jgi:hypothetical protein